MPSLLSLTSPLSMDKQELKEKILNEIEDTFDAWVIFPHHGMVPDYFLRYWDLAEAVSQYFDNPQTCLLYTSPSPRDRTRSRMPSSA